MLIDTITNKSSWQQKNPSCSSVRPWSSLNLSNETMTVLSDTELVFFSYCTETEWCQLHRDAG